MDPLSICASAVALIGTSKAVTKALYSFTRYATHAETHVASLCSEIATLTEFLSSIDTTLKSCRRNARAFALIDAELWCQSDLALQDCEATLKELSAFVARLKPSNEKSKTAFWRAKVAVDMSIHGRQLEQFRTRLQRSNYALQTVLQTVTVSVSVQNNASQDRLMLELDKLKVYIEHAVSIGARSPVGSRRQPTATTLSDTVAAKHLQGLVKAAESFYSNATSTVGSSFGGSVAADWPPPARETIPGLSSFRTQRVHEYIQSTSRRMRPPAAAEAKDWHEYSIMDESAELTDNTAKPMTGAPDADCKLPLIGDLGYFDLERTMIEVREDYAVEKMKVGDFEGAVSFLSEALSKLESFCETQVRMRLQTRLGMCYVLQRKAHAACKVVSELERNGGLENREVLHLMHALVMLYVAQSELGRADDLGHKIVNAKMRLLGKSHPETLMTLGFLERMYCNFTMLLRLVAIRRHIPPDYVYSHPESELDFLTRHAMLMPAVVIETDKVELPGTPVLEDSAQTAGKGDTPSCDVKRALGRYERQPTDTTRPFESQPTDTMKTFVSISVIQPDDAAPNKRSSVRNGQRLLLVSRSMTTIRRHLSTWRPLSSRVERHGRDASEGPNTGRCRTVLHKAPPASRMEPAGSTRLVRARKFLSMMKKEMPTVGVPAENFPVVFELDSRCISREDHARQLSAAHGGSVASTADVAGREPRRVSGRPLNTSLGVIVELPELDSGDAYGLKSQAAAATEESEKSEKSSASSLSRGSSLSDNHSSVSGSICSGSTCSGITCSGSTYNGSTYSGSTCSGSTCSGSTCSGSSYSGSSYSSNTTIPSGAAASCVGEGQCDDSPALRSMSQRHRAVRLVKNGSFSSVHRSRASMPCSTRFSLLSSIRRHDSTHELKGRRATHPAMGCPSKACRPDCLPGTSPTVDTGRNSDGRGRQARPAGADVQMAVNGWGGGLQDGPEQAAAEQRHGLKRTFSWSYGDERCFLVKVARKEPHCSVA